MADSESEKFTKDVEAWRNLFHKVVQNQGKYSIEISDLEEAVNGINSKDLRADYNLQDYQFKYALKDLKKADKNKDGMIDFAEWVNY